MIGFEDLDTDPNTFVSSARLTAEEIKNDAHIANGGTAEFSCPACKGSGVFRSYTGRVVGNCFKCKGTRKVSKGVAAAAKARVTKEQNRIDRCQAFREEHPAEFEFMARSSEWSAFYRSLLDKFNEYGLLTENQLVAVRNGMQKAEQRRAEKQAERTKPVDVSAIETLFNTARESGLKRLAFRTMHIDISAAKETGRNPGALYVKHDGEYVGKIVNGKFAATYAAKTDTYAKVLEVAADPLGMAKFYGKQTGKCSCCGRELTDPQSIAAGIGPICAAGWGF